MKRLHPCCCLCPGNIAFRASLSLRQRTPRQHRLGRERRRERGKKRETEKDVCPNYIHRPVLSGTLRRNGAGGRLQGDKEWKLFLFYRPSSNQSPDFCVGHHLSRDIPATPGASGLLLDRAPSTQSLLPVGSNGTDSICGSHIDLRESVSWTVLPPLTATASPSCSGCRTLPMYLLPSCFLPISAKLPLISGQRRG